MISWANGTQKSTTAIKTNEINRTAMNLKSERGLTRCQTAATLKGQRSHRSPFKISENEFDKYLQGLVANEDAELSHLADQL
jgi:hypothetical protein